VSAAVSSKLQSASCGKSALLVWWLELLQSKLTVIPLASRRGVTNLRALLADAKAWAEAALHMFPRIHFSRQKFLHSSTCLRKWRMQRTECGGLKPSMHCLRLG